ncbi:MAG: cyclic nucleotide-binding domain-containing protein [Gammaproteobacteria bacterium]|nr:cyclic nucleotide-binding domain-containing protein [Gammaproteobacteria bacterium]
MSEKPTDPGILRDIPIFSSLSEAELSEILKSEDNSIEEFGPKEVIIRESEIGDCMFVMMDGIAEVSIRSGGGGREVTIATLRPGDFFGEASLLPENTDRRNASVRAMHQCTVFKIDKRHVLLSVKAEFDEEEEITVRKASPLGDEVVTLLKGMRLFNSLADEELAAIGNWTEILTVGPGDFVLKESESGDFLYVVLDGTVEIFTLDEDGKITMLAEHGRGNYFGEQALLPGSSGTRNAYVRSNDEVRLIQVPKEYFRLVINRDSVLFEALKKIGAAQNEEIKKIHGS